MISVRYLVEAVTSAGRVCRYPAASLRVANVLRARLSAEGALVEILEIQ